MGLVWVVLSAFLLLLAAACLLNFPYIPLFFGLHGANGQSLRGKILSKALSIFPVLALICVGLGWFLSPLGFVLPFVWLVLIWVLRPRSAPELVARFASSDENRALLARSLTYELGQLESSEAAGHYLLCRLQCPSAAVAQHICTLLAHLPQHSEPSIKPFADETICEVRISLVSLAEPAVAELVEQVNQCAWSHQSIVSSVSILRD